MQISGYTPKIMIIDDIEDNIRVLGMLLQENNYQIEAAMSANMALDQLQIIHPDLILLDIMMPEMDGYELCKLLKNNPNTTDIPVIFVTARNDEEALLKGFDYGAVDFITKPFNPKELLVRVKNHLDLKLSKQIINDKITEITEINRKLNESKKEIEDTYKKLQNEVVSAAEYVQSLLPARIHNDVIETDWLFAPSHSLGGDSFGYHWLDEDNLAIYLLDVSGHGVASALQSVSVLNMLRFSTLPDVDFREPANVFTELNKAYQIQQHNFLFFTIFFAVYNRKTRKLKYASAGHPPTFLITKLSSTQLLASQNMLIGTTDNFNFIQNEIHIDHNSSLVIYSDGIIDAYTFDMEKWNEDTLQIYMEELIRREYPLSVSLDYLKKISYKQILVDDVSILKIKFK